MRFGLRLGNHVVLTSDDDEILSEAAPYSEVSLRRRPPDLATDQATDQETLLDALHSVEEASGKMFRSVTMLQPTSPGRQLQLAKDGLEKFTNTNFSAVWSVQAVPTKFHPYKQLELRDGALRTVVSTGKPWRRQDLGDTYVRTGDFYIVSRETLISDPTLLGDYAGFIVSSGPNVNIDSTADLIRARQILFEGEDGLLEHR